MSVYRRKLNEQQREAEMIRDGASFWCVSPLGTVIPRKVLTFPVKLVDLGFCHLLPKGSD